MYCNNCGELGHYSRQCNKPITSYGVILFTYIEKIPKIVMIQRKDSLCYIEIIRGKYNLKNIKLIKLLLTRISIEEKNNILNKNFEELWKELWLLDKIEETKYMKEYNKSKKLFNSLKKGYMINNNFYNLEYFFNDIPTNYVSTEWEFPKGKKKNGETYLEASERELQEETNIKRNDYEIIKNIKQIQEEFIGENNIKYKNIYYIGYCCNINNIKIDNTNKEQLSEIKNVMLKSKEECMNSIRDYNKTKKDLVELVYTFLSNYENDFTIE